MEERPLPEYAALTGAFWSVFALFLLVGRRRLPERLPAGDMARIALSTYKISRVITKEEIGAFIRAPVTEDPAAQVPKRDGMEGAIGRLLTCPYCVGLWITTGLAFSQVFFPRETRFATSIFGSYAATDFLHAGFVRLRHGRQEPTS